MKIKSGFVLEKVGEEYLAVAVGERAKEFSGFVRLNGSGAYFWNLLCEGDKTEEEIVDTAMRDFVDVDRALVESDVSRFVKNLIDGGIVEV